jgi:hypothetical protein
LAENKSSSIRVLPDEEYEKHEEYFLPIFNKYGYSSCFSLPSFLPSEMIDKKLNESAIHQFDDWTYSIVLARKILFFKNEMDAIMARMILC